MESWWLDEGAHAGPEHLEPDYVAGYDAKAQVDPWQDIESLMRFGLGDSSTVLDLGAGTGTFAFAAASTGAAVTAVDVSPAMVAAMRDRTTQVSRGTLDIVRAGFMSYEHGGAPFDFVYSRNALHQIPDFWKALALHRISSFIRPGGMLLLRDLVYDFEPDETRNKIEDWMSGAVDDSRRGYTASEFAEHVRSEFSTFSWLLEPMLERTGLEVVEREFVRSIYAKYLCRRTATI